MITFLIVKEFQRHPIFPLEIHSEVPNDPTDSVGLTLLRGARGRVEGIRRTETHYLVFSNM